MNLDSSIRVVPVIMAGGSGTRLWPLSRSGFPKQFLALNGTSSLFQQAAQRLCRLGESGLDVRAPIIVTNEEHRFLALGQLNELSVGTTAVVLEPCARNTAPALTLAALQALDAGGDPVLVVSPADQGIADNAAFDSACREAVRLAADGGIVILGIAPTRAETGFGYILADADTGSATVRRFVEKPDRHTAERYLAEGGYFWNSGMFMLKASVWLEALHRFRPEIAESSTFAFEHRSRDGVFVRPGRSEFEAVPAESIDYAVMEHCPGSEVSVRMVPLNAGWTDLGTWDAVWQAAGQDAQGNARVGDAVLSGCTDTLVHGTSRLVAAVGLSNVVVVETPDAVLVVDRASSQDVKQVIGDLHAAGRAEPDLHRKVHRPWGWYDSIDSGPRFQVKRILVKPGASLSLQMHHHRAEHWIVVRGTAEVTCGHTVTLLTENQSTYIPLGEKHRLSNPGKVPLEIIEVQSGDYLGEDDIVRFEDTYGRA